MIMRCECCFNCEKRQIGCHGNCEKYIEYQKDNEIERKETHKDNEERYFKICAVNKTKRRYCH